MSKKGKGSRGARDKPTIRADESAAAAEATGKQGAAAKSSVALATSDFFKILCEDGYKPLSACPEVQMCVNVYAQLIASMTIHLMQNTEKGDIRIKNGLSRKVDIEPNRRMVHQTFFENIVKAMMNTGNQVTMIKYRDGLLDELIPVRPSRVNFVDDGDDYQIRIGGVPYSPDEVLHFPYNTEPERPCIGRPVTVHLGDVIKSLRQSMSTKNAIMEHPMPSVIIKADGLNEELKKPESREKMARQYVTSTEAGIPWMIQAEMFEVQQVKPLSINDLAIPKNMELDKRSVAAMIGVPPYLVGAGDYKEEEHRHFVTTRLMPVANIIQQVLTKGLLYSPDMYWRMNNRSLMNYDLEKLVNSGSVMVDRMALRRNEWRDWTGLPPDAEMDTLLGLENYLPVDLLGEQKKLVTNTSDEGGEGQ